MGLSATATYLEDDRKRLGSRSHAPAWECPLSTLRVVCGHAAEGKMQGRRASGIGVPTQERGYKPAQALSFSSLQAARHYLQEFPSAAGQRIDARRVVRRWN